MQDGCKSAFEAPRSLSHISHGKQWLLIPVISSSVANDDYRVHLARASSSVGLTTFLVPSLRLTFIDEKTQLPYFLHCLKLIR